MDKAILKEAPAYEKNRRPVLDEIHEGAPSNLRRNKKYDEF